MGSIQALRSEALALRAKTDTDLQVSSHLGGVNKTLGGQIVSIVDQLQGVISERTKAYNGMVSKLNKSINGNGGIGEKGVKLAFAAVNTTIAIVALIREPAAKTAIDAATDLTTLILDAAGASLTLQSAIYDYKKEVSQLGMSDVDKQETLNSGLFPAGGITDAGTAGLMGKRDALMPRYKGHYVYGMPSSYPRGYVGTLRRI